MKETIDNKLKNKIITKCIEKNNKKFIIYNLMSAIPVGLTSNLYGEKIRLNSAKRVPPLHVVYKLLKIFLIFII